MSKHVMHWQDRFNPNNIFKKIELSNSDDLLKLRGFSNEFLFRGQSNEQWKLETSIERQVKLKKSSPSQEEIMLKEFQMKAHNYMQNIPDYENIIEWLALMQHFGAPTRLLDFSKSMFISTFFAVENHLTDDDAAIWGISQSALYHIYMENVSLRSLSSDNGIPNQEKINCHLKNKNSIDGVVPITPFKMNERLMIQQGTFFLPLNINATFEYNLFSTFNTSADIQNSARTIKFSETNFEDIVKELMLCSIVKIIIPAKIKYDLLSFLRHLNIQPQYLFPGLEGLARSQIHFLDCTKSSFTYKR